MVCERTLLLGGLLLVLALGASARPQRITTKVIRSKPPAKEDLVARSDSSTTCMNGRWHHLSYSTLGYSESSYIQLEEMGLTGVDCDVDRTRLKLTFKDRTTAAKWFLDLEVFGTYFLTGGAKYNCELRQNKTSVFIRRVLGASYDLDSLHVVNVKTVIARYDELYNEADIAYASGGTCSEGDVLETAVASQSNVEKHICVGFNTDCKSGATETLPIFSNQFITVTCSDCFLGFSADAFLNVSIHDWTLKYLKAGFQDMTMSGAIVLDVVAQLNWGTGVDKVLELIKDLTIINFNIGPVPFQLHFDVPVEIKANIGFQAQAEATFGALADWNLGDSYVEWAPDTHWTHVRMDPQVNWNTTFSASAKFEADASFSVIPTVNMHFDNFFTYRLTFTPELDGQLTWDSSSKEMCAKLTYDLDLSCETELAINIPWANVEDDWSWNKQLWDSGTVPIDAKCIATNKTLEA